jgi:hypothetical protein
VTSEIIVFRGYIMGGERLWLDVPFSEKDAAKAAGARWDQSVRRWYAPQPGMTALDRWRPAPPIPDLLPGEDRAFGSGLFVDLVPSTCWFTNARSCLSQQDWDRVRRMVVGRAGQRCEICGATKDREVRRWLEVHERWAYDDAARVQRLRRLICLCTDCHTVTHYGLAQLRGLDAAARAHLIHVTGFTPLQADQHLREAFTVWRERSRHVWALDLSLLTHTGITPVPPLLTLTE